MSWLELRLPAREESVETYENLLLETGALAVTYTDAGDQPILEPDVGTTPLWKEILLVALYDANVVTAEVEQDITRQLDVVNPEQLCWNILEDRVWEREWLQYQQPAKFGDAFWVYHEVVDSRLPTLLLDPGLAFGTGSHPTTALCLEWIATQHWESESVLDFGCGSGILALAALMCGAGSATCVDIDPQALDATKNNLLRNTMQADQLRTFLPAEAPEDKVPVLLANILASPLVKLAPLFANKVIVNGRICLSGILAEQETDILDAYRPWFDDLTTQQQDDWLRITGRRNNQLAEAAQ